MLDDVKRIEGQVVEVLLIEHKPKMGTFKLLPPPLSKPLTNITKSKQVECSHMESLNTYENELMGDEPRVDTIIEVMNSNPSILGMLDKENGIICKEISTMVKLVSPMK